MLEPGVDGGIEFAVKPDPMAVRTTSEKVEWRTCASTTRATATLPGRWRSVNRCR